MTDMIHNGCSDYGRGVKVEEEEVRKGKKWQRS